MRFKSFGVYADFSFLRRTPTNCHVEFLKLVEFRGMGIDFRGYKMQYESTGDIIDHGGYKLPLLTTQRGEDL